MKERITSIGADIELDHFIHGRRTEGRVKLCMTCGAPLWLVWLITGWPWEKRVKTLKETMDCTDLLPVSMCDCFRREAEEEGR